MTITPLRLLLPESIWLEPEHYEAAQQQCLQNAQLQRQDQRELDHWQTYIHRLAQLSFQDWLSEQLLDADVSFLDSDGEPACAAGYLTVDNVRVCVIATEQVLDETIEIPRLVVDIPYKAAHYYVAVEVLEEEQQAIIRGFLSYDAIGTQRSRFRATQQTYCVPLSALDTEPNHLVAYIQQLVHNPISSLVAASSPTVDQIEQAASAQSLVAKLGDWLDESVTAGWQAIDELINPQSMLAIATRSSATAVKAGKLINLGIQLGEPTVALLITVVPDEANKLSVQAQLLPTGALQTLPAGLKLSLISAKGKVLQEVIAREQDNFIQLRTFKGKQGIRFSVEVEIAQISVREAFEL